VISPSTGEVTIPSSGTMAKPFPIYPFEKTSSFTLLNGTILPFKGNSIFSPLTSFCRDLTLPSFSFTAVSSFQKIIVAANPSTMESPIPIKAIYILSKLCVLGSIIPGSSKNPIPPIANFLKLKNP